MPMDLNNKINFALKLHLYNGFFNGLPVDPVAHPLLPQRASLLVIVVAETLISTQWVISHAKQHVCKDED